MTEDTVVLEQTEVTLELPAPEGFWSTTAHTPDGFWSITGHNTGPAQECNHEWRHYVGLSEIFEYCIKCDKKKVKA